MAMEPIGFIRHVVELRVPVIAAVGRFPDASGGEADVQQHRILLRADDVVQAAHHDGRTDGAELETAQHRVGGFVGLGLRRGRACAQISPASARPAAADDQRERPGVLQRTDSHRNLDGSVPRANR